MKKGTLRGILVAGLIMAHGAFYSMSAVADTMGGTANAAQKTSSKDSAVQMASLAMAAMLAAQCGPKNPMACVMAAMAAAQAGAAGKAGKGAATTASMQSQGANNVDVPSGTPGADAQLAQLQRDLSDKGVSISEDGKSVNLPGGQSVAMDSSSLSAAGMQANGFSAEEISAAEKALAEAQDKVGKAKFSTGGEIASGNAGGGAGGSSASYSAGSVSYVKRERRAAAANVSGMSKNLGTDKIGVSADHIFEMISRRYKAKDATDTFLKN